MREGITKISGYDNLFYDSVDRLYRYRMHCPVCGKVSGCRCFDNIDIEKIDDFDSMSMVCSSKCCLIAFIDEQGIDDIRDTMKEIDNKDWILIRSRLKRYIIRYIVNFFTVWRLKWYIFKYTGYISEKDAYRIINDIELDYDPIEGESC